MKEAIWFGAIPVKRSQISIKLFHNSFDIYFDISFQGMGKRELVALFYKTVMKPVQTACHSIRRIGEERRALQTWPHFRYVA